MVRAFNSGQQQSSTQDLATTHGYHSHTATAQTYPVKYNARQQRTSVSARRILASRSATSRSRSATVSRAASSRVGRSAFQSVQLAGCCFGKVCGVGGGAEWRAVITNPMATTRDTNTTRGNSTQHDTQGRKGGADGRLSPGSERTEEVVLAQRLRNKVKQGYLLVGHRLCGLELSKRRHLEPDRYVESVGHRKRKGIGVWIGWGRGAR